MVFLEVDPPAGTPWWGWLIAVAIPGIVSVVIALVSRKDMREVKDQVQNTHTTNLRVDLDTTKGMASDAATDAKLARESAHRTERLATDLVISMRAVEHSLDRHATLSAAAVGQLREDLHAHVGEVPDVVATALREAARITERHVRDHEKRWHQPPDSGV